MDECYSLLKGTISGIKVFKRRTMIASTLGNNSNLQYNFQPKSLLLARPLGDCPNLSGLIRAHEQPSCLVKGKTRRSETVVVPDIGDNLPAFVDVWVTHDVDDCGLAVRRSDWESIGEVNLGDLVTRGTFTIPDGKMVSLYVCTLKMEKLLTSYRGN